jgi:hypothetical protein
MSDPGRELSGTHLATGAKGANRGHSKSAGVEIASCASHSASAAKVIAAHLLAIGQSLTFRQQSGKLQIDVASRAPDPNVSTIALNTL